jgi:hypothetical protein
VFGANHYLKVPSSMLSRADEVIDTAEICCDA